MSGWPALTRLALTAGPHVSIDYLFEEVIGDLSDKLRIGLATTIVGRRVNDELLSHVSPGGASVDDLVREIPLVVDLGDGFIAAHDLWPEGGLLLAVGPQGHGLLAELSGSPPGPVPYPVDSRPGAP